MTRERHLHANGLAGQHQHGVRPAGVDDAGAQRVRRAPARPTRPRGTGGRAGEWDAPSACPCRSPGSRTPRGGSSRPPPSRPARRRPWRTCGRRAATASVETTAGRAGPVHRRAADHVASNEDRRSGTRKAGPFRARVRSVIIRSGAPLGTTIRRPSAHHPHHAGHAGVGLRERQAVEMDLRAGRQAGEIEQHDRRAGRAPASGPAGAAGVRAARRLRRSPSSAVSPLHASL